MIRSEDLNVVARLECFVVLDPNEIGARLGDGRARHVDSASNKAVSLLGVIFVPTRLVCLVIDLCVYCYYVSIALCKYTPGRLLYNSWPATILTLDFESDVHLLKVGYHRIRLSGSTDVEAAIFQGDFLDVQIVVDNLVARGCNNTKSKGIRVNMCVCVCVVIVTRLLAACLANQSTATTNTNKRRRAIQQSNVSVAKWANSVRPEKKRRKKKTSRKSKKRNGCPARITRQTEVRRMYNIRRRIRLYAFTWSKRSSTNFPRRRDYGIAPDVASNREI